MLGAFAPSKTPRSGRTRPDASHGGKSAGGESAGRESGRGKKVHRTSSSFSSSEQRRRRSLSRIARQQQKGAFALSRKPGKAPSSRAGRGVGRSVPLFLGEGRTGRRPGRRCSRASGPTRFRPLAFFWPPPRSRSLAFRRRHRNAASFSPCRVPLFRPRPSRIRLKTSSSSVHGREPEKRGPFTYRFSALKSLTIELLKEKVKNAKKKNRRRSLSVAFRPLSSR